MQRLNIWELVVGDVVILHAGDKIPSDCIAIEAVNL
jgi:magnesium-transporting ATPase (P-type)